MGFYKLSRGSIEGTFQQDSIASSSSRWGALTFGVVSSIQGDLLNILKLDPFDGQLAGSPSASSVMQKLVDQARIPQASLIYWPSPSGNDDARGKVVFGGSIQDLTPGWKVVSIPQSPRMPHYWAVDVQRISLKSQASSPWNVKLCEASPQVGCRLILETASTIISAPATVVDVLTRHLKPNLDCSAMDQLPSLVFEFTGVSDPLVLPGSHLVSQLNLDTDLLPTDEHQTVCTNRIDVFE